jgi:hypothetical protein
METKWEDRCYLTMTLLSKTDVVEALRSRPTKFYVYILRKPNGVPFYVGKGCGNRVFQHEREAFISIEKNHKLNIIRKHANPANGGYLRYDIEFFESEDEAHIFEKQLIKEIGRHDLRLGPLANQTDGGEGTSNPSLESLDRRLRTLGGLSDNPSRRAANEYFNSLFGEEQASVPIKPTNQFKFNPLAPSVKSIRPTLRMAKALVASAIANDVLLTVGARIPRKLNYRGEEFGIENGCGCEMIKAGLVQTSFSSDPLSQQLILTSVGLNFLRSQFGDNKLRDFGILEPE